MVSLSLIVIGGDRWSCAVSFRAHRVPDSPHGNYQRPVGARIDLLPQPIDEYFDEVGQRVVVRVPHRLRDHVARHHLSGVSHQQFEQHLFFRRQTQIVLADFRAPLDGVELQVSDLENRRGCRARTPCQRLDSRHQLGKRERLGQVVVAATVESRHAFLERPARRQDQNGGLVARRAHLAQQFEPAFPGQPDVEHDQVERAVRDYRFGRLGAPGDFDREVLFDQPLLD
jgi:hypothetical protein